MTCKKRLLRVLMTDRRLGDPMAAARRLPAGSWVILRFPMGEPPPPYAMALRNLCRQRRLRFLVSTDPKLAAKLRADGLHLPEASSRHGCLSKALAWRKSGQGRLLTVAAHSRPALARATSLKADAAILSPLFATASHPDARPLGVLLFRKWAASAGLSIIALGGVTTDKARLLRARNLRGLASVFA